MNNYFGLKKGDKKILVLVKCPKCGAVFYIDEKFLNLDFEGKPIGQQCRMCGRQVNLIKQ